jgi:hypothetical protein
MSGVRSEEITPTIAAHVLWHFDGEVAGLEPGSFVAHLLRAIAAADPTNREGLALGFPGYVHAVDLASKHPQGLYLLSQIVGGNDAPPQL